MEHTLLSYNTILGCMALLTRDDFVSHLWLGLWVFIEVITEPLSAFNLLWDPWSEVSCQESNILRCWHLPSWPDADEFGKPHLQSLWPLFSESTSNAGLIWFPTLQRKVIMRKYLLLMMTSVWACFQGRWWFINLLWKCSNIENLKSWKVVQRNFVFPSSTHNYQLMVNQVWSLPLLPSYHHGIILKKIPDIIIFHLNVGEYVQELAL